MKFKKQSGTKFDDEKTIDQTCRAMARDSGDDCSGVGVAF
jgi:hypothetical protein